MGDVPPKDQPPGYAVRYNRWTRRWLWRNEASGEERRGFTTRGDALADAYGQLRSRRANQNPES